MQTIIEVVAERGELIEADSHAQRRGGADDLLDRLNNFKGQPHPIFERTAVPIGSMIEEGRSERSEKAIMGDLDLDAVEAGVQIVAGARGKAGDNGSNVILIKRFGAEMARRLGHLCGRPHDVWGTLQ